MTNSKKVRTLAVQVEFKGKGGVNYDSSDQKWVFNKLPNMPRVSNDNVKLHKGNYYNTMVNNESVLVKKQKLSADCIREAIFHDKMPIYNSSLYMNPKFCSIIASPSFLLRGYMFAETEKGFPLKRKSPFIISAAEQTSEAVATLEVGTTRDGVAFEDKGELHYKLSELSLRSKENFGDITYVATGFIDLGELALIVADDRYLRQAIDRDLVSEFKNSLEKNLKTNGVEEGFFEKINSETKSMEYGLHMTSAQVNYIVNYLFKLIFQTRIARATGFAEVSKLSYKYMYEGDITSKVITDATSYTEFDGTELSFDFAPAYVKVSDSVAMEWKKSCSSIDAQILTERKAKKEEKDKDKEAKKKEREAKNTK